MSEQGRCMQCFSLENSIKKLLFYEEKNVLVSISENLMLTQHAVFGEGDTKEILKVPTYLSIYLSIMYLSPCN